MPDSWLTPQTIALVVAVIVFLIRLEAVSKASRDAIERLEKQLERHTSASAARVAELERMIQNAERMIAALGPRQRDVDRLEREVEAMWKRIDKHGEHLAAIQGRHTDLERDSDPRAPRTRESE